MYLGTFSRRARSLATCFCFARVRIIGAVALANIFAGRQPYFLPKMASKSVMVPMPFYKRSSFIDIPFGMPYFKLFYF